MFPTKNVLDIYTDSDFAGPAQAEIVRQLASSVHREVGTLASFVLTDAEALCAVARSYDLLPQEPVVELLLSAPTARCYKRYPCYDCRGVAEFDVAIGTSSAFFCRWCAVERVGDMPMAGGRARLLILEADLPEELQALIRRAFQEVHGRPYP